MWPCRHVFVNTDVVSHQSLGWALTCVAHVLMALTQQRCAKSSMSKFVSNADKIPRKDKNLHVDLKHSQKNGKNVFFCHSNISRSSCVNHGICGKWFPKHDKSSWKRHFIRGNRCTFTFSGLMESLRLRWGLIKVAHSTRITHFKQDAFTHD